MLWVHRVHRPGKEAVMIQWTRGQGLGGWQGWDTREGSEQRERCVQGVRRSHAHACAELSQKGSLEPRRLTLEAQRQMLASRSRTSPL